MVDQKKPTAVAAAVFMSDDEALDITYMVTADQATLDSIIAKYGDKAVKFSEAMELNSGYVRVVLKTPDESVEYIKESSEEDEDFEDETEEEDTDEEEETGDETLDIAAMNAQADASYEEDGFKFLLRQDVALLYAENPNVTVYLFNELYGKIVKRFPAGGAPDFRKEVFDLG